MTCPDEARLDLWLDNALPVVEAAAVTAHVAECLRCTAQVAERQAEERVWRRALALDHAELAFLRRASLDAAWQPQPVAVGLAAWWPALLAFGLMASYVAWLALLPVLAETAGLAGRFGLAALLVTALVALVRDLLASLSAMAAATAPTDPMLLMAVGSFLLWLLVARPWHLVRSSY